MENRVKFHFMPSTKKYIFVHTMKGNWVQNDISPLWLSLCGQKQPFLQKNNFFCVFKVILVWNNKGRCQNFHISVIPLKLRNYVIEEAEICHKNNNLQYPQDPFFYIFFRNCGHFNPDDCHFLPLYIDYSLQKSGRIYRRNATGTDSNLHPTMIVMCQAHCSYILKL